MHDLSFTTHTASDYLKLIFNLPIHDITAEKVAVGSAHRFYRVKEVGKNDYT
jgi:hypothetical protein